MVANELIAMLRHSQEALPQDASAGMSHGLLMTLWWAAKAVLRDDLAGRLSTARAMMDAVRRYEANDQYPRALFWLQGELAMEIARAASDALDRAPVEQVRLARELGADSAAAQSQASNLLTNAIDENLDSATVAFERAEATGVVAPLVEPYTDAQMAELHGGALYAKGDEASARKAYARALDKFIEAGEPVEQVVVFAKIVAHWASLRIAEGACKEGAHVVPDRAWEDSWARLSNTPYDVCRLAKPGYGVEQPVPLASIEPLIKHAVMGCPPPPGPDETKQMKRGDAFKKRIALIDCQRNKVDLMAGSLPSAEAMDAEITQALDTVR
jgi:hypothetical protein